MDATASRSFGAEFDSFIEDRVEAGEYRNADDVLKAGLKLLQARQRKLEALRAALKEGELSGDFQEIDWDLFWAERELPEASR